MSGQVGVSGIVQHAVAPVLLHCLQGVADPGLLVTIVDNEGRTAIRRNPLGESAGQRFARRRTFDDGAGRRTSEADLDGDRIGGGEAERLGRGRERDDAFLPCAVDSLELLDR